MGNNNLKGTNDILVKVDQNNLIYIDPNSVISNGEVIPREVQPENLMMYVNLEADLVPRSTLITSDEKSTLTYIAGGNVSFMRNKDGGDYDTTWTDVFTSTIESTPNYTNTGTNNQQVQPVKNTYKNDTSAQSFGIDSISIQVTGANFIPRVVIKFIDVRGKTLFESPPDSPYAAFFHLPWPIFYLTIKGYYGKAIRYRLHLVKFNTRFNSSSGNFEIETNFVGSTYAYLADISLECVLNAPYFYLSQSDTQKPKYNQETGYYDVIINKSTKGYRILKSVYREYISKGLLPPNFPVRTLREMIVLAKRLDKILAKVVFEDVIDPSTLAGVKDYEEQVITFENELLSWRTKHLTSETFTDGTTKVDTRGNVVDVLWYMLAPNERSKSKSIFGPDTSTLESIINKNIKKLNSNQTFGTGSNKSTKKNKKLTINSVSFDKIKDLKKFYRIKGSVYGIDFDGLLDGFYDSYKDFTEQRVKLENDIEAAMNKTVKRKDLGLGFEPTIRNIIGVILANAETYVRLMKDVHYRAFEKGNERKKLLAGVLTDSPKPGESIYPWPEVKVSNASGKELILTYPGSKELADKLQTYNKVLWPEVDFVENFYEISTKKSDNLGDENGNDPDNINYIFDIKSSTIKKDIDTISTISNYLPYSDKSMSSIIYEIYERAKYSTSLTPFDNSSVIQLANIEFDNLKDQIIEDVEIVDMLKNRVKSVGNLYQLLMSLSPYERFPYFEDQLPTIEYIKDELLNDFGVQKYIKNEEPKAKGYADEYNKLSNFLMNYTPESYRVNIYPFNSTTYKSYLGNFETKDLYLNGILEVNPPEDFISSPKYPSMWVNESYVDNLFINTVEIGGYNKHILNTPYFHKQLFDDFNKSQVQEKYVGSAYLLLNSLPFKNLDEKINGSNIPLELRTVTGDKEVLISTLFREIGATHYIPYHLMLKWGSIYHRYKKFIQTGNDIIANVTSPISGSTFFDAGIDRTYTGSTSPLKTITWSNQNDIGFHPYYDTVFHQIVNGYSFFDHSVGPTSYTSALINGTVKTKYLIPNELNSWTSFVDNSTFDPSFVSFYSTNTGYTILPSNGYNDIIVPPDGFLNAEQENFRVVWNVGTTDKNTVVYSGYTLPTYGEYFKSTGDTLSFSSNYKKVIDLIATFKPEILDMFEEAFLDFASEKLNEEITYNRYDVKYAKFQDLLREIVTVSKNTNDPSDTLELITKLKERQTSELETLTQSILSYDNLIKFTIGNPREIDNYVLGGFTGWNVKNFSVNSFDVSQIAPNQDNLDLYLGQDVDSTNYYTDFFAANNIQINEENIKQFRPLIYMYAGLRAAGSTYSGLDNNTFISYLKTNIINGQDNRLSLFLNQLVTNIQDPRKLEIQSPSKVTTFQRGFNDDNTLMLELYNYFKSFNDKWSSGNSIGQRTLLEEFLFLDKANRDIGDKVYLDMEKIIRYEDRGNEKISLFNAIALLVQDTGFDIRALPAYVNFYGTNYSNVTKTVPSKSVAQNIFGTFLEVDYQDSSPRIILQYIGPTSKHPEVSDVDPTYKRNKFKTDSFNISDVHNNPIIVTPDVFAKTDYSKSNKVVAFEVSFGDQNQSIFKGVELDQTSIKNTTESFIVMENLGRSESGSNTAQVDVGLFDIYRQASYTCNVTCMGNVMIQPTMYFYLKNIPLFRGSYWITEVTHNIKTTGIETTFKGTRIPAQSLPKPEDSFLASYRPLFDKLVKQAQIKVQESQSAQSDTTTQKTAVDNKGIYTYDMGSTAVKGEQLIKEYSYTPYGIPYNGYDGEKYIQLISYPQIGYSDGILGTSNWLRAKVLQIQGNTYKLPMDSDMSLLSRRSMGRKVTYRDVVGSIHTRNNNLYHYITKFHLKLVGSEYILDNFSKTIFLNPKTRKFVDVPTYIDYNSNVYSGPISVGPNIEGYGIGLSPELMRDLGIYDGEVVYFKMVE